MAENIIELKNIKASYGSERILHEVSLTIRENEFLVMIGPSGCGKTTLLKVINGLVWPENGEVIIAGENLKDCNIVALRRHIGYAVQGAKLFPHMTVMDNICYVPSLDKKLTAQEKEALAEEMLALVKLPPELSKRFPAKLSGGQQQRVGIARALANHPKILLMDEPFGAVDEITRRSLQEEMLSLHEKTHATIVFITHDIREAMRLGTRVVVMKEGRIIQEGTKEELLNAPADGFVASLLEGI